MANLRLLKGRIKSAKNIKQITKAMEMVAASKVRRAQEKTVAQKPYSQKLVATVHNLIGRIEESNHPYLTKSEKGKTLLVIFSPDKGLCGSLPTNIMREYIKFARDNKNFDVVVVGKKLQSSLAHVGAPIVATFPAGTTVAAFDAIYPIAGIITDGYNNNVYNEVKVLYTEFLSMSRQKTITQTLLPIEKMEAIAEEQVLPFRFEPNPETLLESLMPHYLEVTLYQIMIESFTSEQAAKMLAMHQASENAGDVITDLTLAYNKSRQEKITSELLDIVTATMVV